MLERRILQDINQRQQERQQILANRQDREASGKTKRGLRRESKRRRRERWVKQAAILLVVLLAAAWFVLTYVTTSATVTITPVARTAIFSGDAVTFSAYSDPGVDELAFEYVVLSEEASQVIPGVEIAEEESFASGTVTLFNELLVEQRLQAKTRLQSENGNIYYLEDRGVTIPAATTDGPGTITLTATAAEPGEDYNLESGTLTIPGWNELGDPERFEKQYAKITEPLTGGFIGERPLIADDELASITNKLREEVSETLEQRFSQQAYDDYVVTALDALIVYSEVTAETTAEGTLVRLEGEIPVILFENRPFVDYIASFTLPDYDLVNPTIRNKDDFSVSITSLENETLQTSEGLTFTLNGTLTLDAVVKPDQIQSELLGIKADAAQGLLAENAAIDRAEIAIRPLWRQSLPGQPGKIEIIIHQQGT